MGVFNSLVRFPDWPGGWVGEPGQVFARRRECWCLDSVQWPGALGVELCRGISLTWAQLNVQTLGNRLISNQTPKKSLQKWQSERFAGWSGWTGLSLVDEEWALLRAKSSEQSTSPRSEVVSHLPLDYHPSYKRRKHCQVRAGLYKTDESMQKYSFCGFTINAKDSFH